MPQAQGLQRQPHGQANRAAGLQVRRIVGDEVLDLAQVLDALGEDHDVEGLVGGEAAAIAKQHPNLADGDLGRQAHLAPLDGGLGEVDADITARPMRAQGFVEHPLARPDLQHARIGPAVGDHGGQQAVMVALLGAVQAVVEAVLVLGVPLLDRRGDDRLVPLAHEQLAQPRTVQRSQFREPAPAQIGHGIPRDLQVPDRERAPDCPVRGPFVLGSKPC